MEMTIDEVIALIEGMDSHVVTEKYVVERNAIEKDYTGWIPYSQVLDSEEEASVWIEEAIPNPQFTRSMRIVKVVTVMSREIMTEQGP